ncbi:hypothetical protein GWK47_036519 [Chionoecetes opilio]|uniref:Uncharacterized protein n=1 Tax=Chionoecetes opilio TaxID=41210 RepID=A0A8J5CZ00_CHIOP|nr:hypothetical protein GWK47_036519 [Chionoecetes opilio]
MGGGPSGRKTRCPKKGPLHSGPEYPVAQMSTRASGRLLAVMYRAGIVPNLEARRVGAVGESVAHLLSMRLSGPSPRSCLIHTNPPFLHVHGVVLQLLGITHTGVRGGLPLPRRPQSNGITTNSWFVEVERPFALIVVMLASWNAPSPVRWDFLTVFWDADGERCSSAGLLPCCLSRENRFLLLSDHTLVDSPCASDDDHIREGPVKVE